VTALAVPAVMQGVRAKAMQRVSRSERPGGEPLYLHHWGLPSNYPRAKPGFTL